jgi:hypothetical protein
MDMYVFVYKKSKIDQFIFHTKKKQMATERFLAKYISNTKSMTHTLLDGWKGGKVYIPDDAMDAFLSAYCQDIIANKPLYVNELRRCHFRMFLDLDIMNDRMLDESEIIEIVDVTTTCFKRFFPEAYQNKTMFLCIISDACPKSLCVDHTTFEEFVNNEEQLSKVIDPTLPAEDAVVIESFKNFKSSIWNYSYDTIFMLPDGRLFQNTHRVDGKLKHGIHIVFPHIIVKTDHALCMREALLDALTKKFDTKFAHNGWSQVVDNAVYVNSGLRMIYSSKTKICEKCRGKNKGKDCNFCHFGKDTSEGRPYTFKFACMDGKKNDEETEGFKINLHKLVHKAILFTSQNKVTQGWTKYDECPSPGDIIESKSKGPPKLASRERMFSEEKKTTKYWKNKLPITDSEVISVILRNISTRFVKQYKNIRIRSVVRDEKKYYVSVDGEGSNYCLNLSPPGNHKSNRIWFQIEREGIRIRCFCSCMTTEGRYTGLCKNFQSSIRPLNPTDLKLLFPQAKFTGSLFGESTHFLQTLNMELDEAASAKKQRTN